MSHSSNSSLLQLNRPDELPPQPECAVAQELEQVKYLETHESRHLPLVFRSRANCELHLQNSYTLHAVLMKQPALQNTPINRSRLLRLADCTSTSTPPFTLPPTLHLPTPLAATWTAPNSSRRFRPASLVKSSRANNGNPMSLLPCAPFPFAPQSLPRPLHTFLSHRAAITAANVASYFALRTRHHGH